jgi:beta-lactamase class A
MIGYLTRRELLFLLTAASGPRCAHPRSGGADVASTGTYDDELRAIEASVGGRVGVFALDTGSGRALAHRADERFAMCSTFKWALAAAVLARVDRGELTLTHRLAYGADDLIGHAPVAREHVGEGAMTVETATRAAVTVSDNTAANLLLAQVDGPSGLTAFIRQAGDDVTRLDRTEPSLNANAPGDPRDTTSPRAMVVLMKAVLCGDLLKPTSRQRLADWLVACETGKKRLRAGLPPDWVVGDKTGTGEHMAVNDLAIAIPPARAPVLVAVYMSEGNPDEDLASHESAQAAIGRLVAKEMTRP